MLAGLAGLRLVIDIWSMKLFVRLLGTSGELLDSHLFFYVRYSQLAEWHERQGRLASAARLDAIAERYFQLAPGGDDGPPDAAAMAMAVPQPMTRTNAVSPDVAKTLPPGISDIAPGLRGDRRRRVDCLAAHARVTAG
jgi:hypothetical protein